MKHSGLILARGSKKEFTADVLEAGLLNHSDYVSFAMADGTSVQVARKPLAELSKGAQATIQLAQTKYAERKQLVYLGSAPEGFKPEEMQPFTVLVNKDKQPILVACITGHFDEKGEESGLVHAYETKLEPWLLAMFEKEGNDINKLMEKINNQQVKERFLTELGLGHISISLMAASSRILNFSSNPANKEMPFGWMSGEVEPLPEPKKIEDDGDPFAAPSKEAAPAKVDDGDPFAPPAPQVHVTDTKVTQLNQKKLPAHLQKKADSDVKKEEAVAKGQASPVPKIGGSLASDSRVIAGTHQVVDVPVGMTGKNRKKWFTARLGNLPKGWQEMTQVIVPLAGQPARSLREAGERLSTSTAAISGTAGGKEQALPPAATPEKDPPVVKPEDQPIIPANHKPQLEKVLKAFDGSYTFYDLRGEEIRDPSALHAEEDKYPDFALSMGLAGMGSTVPWKFKDYLKIGQYSLPGLARCAFDTKIELVKLARELMELKKKHNVVDATTTEKKIPAHLRKKVG